MGQFSKNYRTFYQKNYQKALKNMVLGSGIPDPGVKKAPDPGSGSATMESEPGSERIWSQDPLKKTAKEA